MFQFLKELFLYNIFFLVNLFINECVLQHLDFLNNELFALKSFEIRPKTIFFVFRV